MTNNELELLKYLVSEAVSTMGNSYCNDIVDSVLDDFTQQELIDLDKGYHEYNGDPEEHDPERLRVPPDYAALSYLFDKLLDEYHSMQLEKARDYTWPKEVNYTWKNERS